MVLVKKLDNFVQPKLNRNTFNCPVCKAYSVQKWFSLHHGIDDSENFHRCRCLQCSKSSIWHGYKMIYPLTGNAPPAEDNMPKEIKNDYDEARSIVSRSPRSACVLLRLCVEKICNCIEPTGDLNEKIKKLVERGLDKKIEKSLDAVRVIGGQAAHPLEMDLKDDTQTATALFGIVNYISEWAYTREKKINSIFDNLPDKHKKAIKKRDSKTQ